MNPDNKTLSPASPTPASRPTSPTTSTSPTTIPFEVKEECVEIPYKKLRIDEVAIDREESEGRNEVEEEKKTENAQPKLKKRWEETAAAEADADKKGEDKREEENKPDSPRSPPPQASTSAPPMGVGVKKFNTFEGKIPTGQSIII